MGNVEKKSANVCLLKNFNKNFDHLASFANNKLIDNTSFVVL